MDSCLCHLDLLPVSGGQLFDQFDFGRPTHFNVESPVLPLASDKRSLTTWVAVQIATTPAARLDRQLIVSRHRQPNHLILIISRTAAQTGPLRPMRFLRHENFSAFSYASFVATPDLYEPLSGVAVCTASGVAAASAANSASLARFSATYCFADLCNASAFSLLMPSTSRISANSLSATSSADLKPS